MKLREGEGRQREEFVAFLGPAGTGWGERRPGVACCKVGLDRLLIPTAVVANLFRSARVFRWGAAGRGLGDWRSQKTADQETTTRTSLYETDFSPVLDGRTVEKSRESRSSGNHQRPSGDGRHGCQRDFGPILAN